MASAVLDASAVLALLSTEPGAQEVAAVLSESAISSVNLSEVVAKLALAGMPEPAVREALDALQLEVVSLDTEQAYDAGMLRPSTRGAGLSIGDRCCIALALRLGLPALTSDSAWDDPSIGADIRVIR